MNLPLRRILSHPILGWTLYTLAALCLFLVLMFPYEPLQARLLSEVSRGTGLEVRAESWAPAWPIGLAWNGVSATAPGLPRFGADSILLEADPWPLLQGQVLLNGTIRLAGRQGGAGGRLTGRLSLDRWSAEGPGRLTGSVEQLDLSSLHLPLVRQGTLQGTFEQRWKNLASPAELLQGQGTWQADVNRLDLEQVLLGPLTLPSVAFTSLKAKLQCQDGTCRIEGLQGEGPDGTLRGEGVLTLRAPLSESQLILSLSLTVTEPFTRRVPVAALLPGPPGTPFRVTLTGPLARLQANLS